MSDLLPCPFCGNEARASHNLARTEFWVSCSLCGVVRPPRFESRRNTLEGAVAAWNTRHEETCHKVREWEDSPVGHGGYVLVCSRCDCILAQDGEDGPYDGPNYCPNCGARVTRDE